MVSCPQICCCRDVLFNVDVQMAADLHILLSLVLFLCFIWMWVVLSASIVSLCFCILEPWKSLDGGIIDVWKDGRFCIHV